MYSRTLRHVFNVSTKLRESRDLKNVALIAPSLVLARQQIFPYRNIHTSIQNLTEEESISMPKDSTARKIKIDQDAQIEFDKLKENPETEKLIKIYEMEMSILRHSNSPVPSTLRPSHWLELLKLKSKTQRQRYLEFLFKIEKKTEHRKQKKLESQELLEKHREERGDLTVRLDVMNYGVGRNSIFRRITELTMNHLWKWNSLKSIMWGNKLVFDFSYEQYMKPQEIKSCAKQIMESYAINRLHPCPYEIYLCNVDFKGQLMNNLMKFIPSIFDDDFPWTVTSKSFIEVFDKNSIVYLSGHTNYMLEEYDPDTVYIVGAFVDKSYKQPVSLAKAKELGIRAAKLPIDKFLHFGEGSNKNLTLNQVVGVMLDAQIYDWKKALEHVPRRKLFENRVAALERKVHKDLFWSNIHNQVKSPDEFQSAPVHDFSHNARNKLRKTFTDKKEEKRNG